MAVGTGQLASYSATQPHKRMITDKILNLDPYEIVALNALGLDEMAKFSFVNTPGRQYEWLTQQYAPVADTLADTDWTDNSTVTAMTVANGEYFQVGDVVLVDLEYVWVSAVSGDDLTVTRNLGGTQATHESTSVVSIVSRARLEGATASDSPFVEPARVSNFSQILHRNVEISRTNALIPQYGIGGVVEREIDQKFDELMLLLNSSVYHAHQDVGTASTPRGMGNLNSFITTNTSALATAALTRKAIDDELQSCWDNGGSPDLILTGAWAQRKISDFYAGYVRTERSEQLGGIMIKKLMNPIDGREISVVVDRDCQATSLYLLESEKIGLLTIDPMFFEDLGKTKDTAAYGQIVGEYGFVVQDEANHSIISGFSTSA